MLALNFTPELALRAATGKFDLPPKELAALRKAHGVTVFRFRSRHLAQTSAGEPPIFLNRGGKPVPANAVTGPALRALVTSIYEHILTHEWPGPEPHGMTGDYIPTTGVYNPQIAPARTQAIACYALLRMRKTPGIPAAQAHRAAIFARDILERLTHVSALEVNPLDSAIDASAWLIADSLARENERYRANTAEFRIAAIEMVMDIAQDPGAMQKSRTAGERSLIACALALASRSADAPPQSRTVARTMTVALYRETPKGRLVALLPWIGIASAALATDDDPFIGVIALRETRETIWQHQLTVNDLSIDERDLAGGIVFTRGRNPLPTWHTLRPLAFIAASLREPALTDADEFMGQFLNLGRSLRFIMQLTIREPEMHMCQGEQRAIGGVRSALWDQRASLDAASLALLTVCETLIAAESPPKHGP